MREVNFEKIWLGEGGGGDRGENLTSRKLDWGSGRARERRKVFLLTLDLSK